MFYNELQRVASEMLRDEGKVVVAAEDGVGAIWARGWEGDRLDGAPSWVWSRALLLPARADSPH